MLFCLSWKEEDSPVSDDLTISLCKTFASIIRRSCLANNSLRKLFWLAFQEMLFGFESESEEA